jgi:hypothetical protein
MIPASGRRGLGKARVGPDAEVVGRGRGALECATSRSGVGQLGLLLFD